MRPSVWNAQDRNAEHGGPWHPACIGALVVWLVTGVCLAVPAQAQVATDGTLGPATTLSGPDFAIGAELGTQAGANLFHSFEAFSIAAGESARFSGPDSVIRVIGRVTGGVASTIDGTLGVDIPAADLYLMNPAGVVMGPNARLDMTGSLHVSTADQLEFEDGAVFTATPDVPATLTVAEPAAFGFLNANPAGVWTTGAVLGVLPSETITLSGGAVTVEDTVVAAIQGGIGLTATGGPGRVPVDLSAPLPPGPKPSGSVRLIASASAATQLEVGTRRIVDTGASGGTLLIRGGTVTVDGAHLSANTETSGMGGHVEIDATGDIRVRNGGFVAASSIGPGDPGSVIVRTPGTVEISGTNTGVGAFNLAEGSGGRVVVESGALALREDGGLSVNTSGAGNGGTLVVRTGSLELSGAASLSAATSGSGAGGTLDIVVTGPVVVRDPFTSLYTSTFADGHGGTLNLTALTMTVSDGASVGSRALGAGAAGPVTITIHDAFVLERLGALVASTQDTAPGNVTRVRVGSMDLREAGGIDLTAAGSGNAGTLDIIVTGAMTLDGTMTLDGAGNRISSASFGAGNGGTIAISADSLTLSGDSGIESSTEGAGNAGNIVIELGGALTMSGLSLETAPYLASDSLIGASGEGGTITIRARDVDLRDYTTITSLTQGAGAGGHVDIMVDETLHAGGTVFISADTLGAAPAGSVSLSADRIDLGPNSFVATSTFGSGRGGTATLDAETALSIRGGVISADAFSTGDAGTVLIKAPILTVSDDAIVFATTSGLGRGGTISIETETMEVLSGTIMSGSEGPGDAGTTVLVVKGSLTLDGPSSVMGSLRSGSGGGDGRVEIDAGRISVTNGAQISTDTSDTARGGDIDIRSPGPVLVSEGAFDSTGRLIPAAITAQTSGDGDAGAISIQAGSVTLRGNASISSSALGTDNGEGGDILIVTADDVVLEGSPKDGGSLTLISAFSGFGAPAGTVTIRSGGVHLLDGAAILTAADSAGGGGVVLDVRDVVHLADRGRILTSVFGGTGGGRRRHRDPTRGHRFERQPDRGKRRARRRRQHHPRHRPVPDRPGQHRPGLVPTRDRRGDHHCRAGGGCRGIGGAAVRFAP